MEIRYHHSASETAKMNSNEIRKNFLIQQLMQAGNISLTYTHYDRMIIGGIVPKTGTEIDLPNHPELRASFFLERREAGIINVGGNGIITADGDIYKLNKLDALYLGKGTRSVTFQSEDNQNPALFYLLSAPAHQAFPTTIITKEAAAPVKTGDLSTANCRTIYKYIHQEGAQSCQLVMGLTLLENGSVWNTMPAHTHSRRMEVYFYFDMLTHHRVIHLMGEPDETRHIVVNNHEAVISPPWSIHAGCGTAHYGFIWGMAGENKDYSDMDPAPVDLLK